MKKTSALILAAGLSGRMRQEKFSLTLNNGITFLEHIASQYKQFGCNKIIGVLNPNGVLMMNELTLNLPEEFEIVTNEQPERGRFSSIRAGLKRMEEEELVLIQNIDNPAISPELLASLMKAMREADYAYPVFQNKGGHPVLINKRVIKSILLEPSDDLSLKDFLAQFNKSQVEWHSPEILINLNTRSDYLTFLKKL